MSLNVFNSGKKSWLLYINYLEAISGDDLILEVSNNEIIFIQNDISYTLNDLISIQDDSYINNINISGTLNILNNLYVLNNIKKNNENIETSIDICINEYILLNYSSNINQSNKSNLTTILELSNNLNLNNSSIETSSNIILLDLSNNYYKKRDTKYIVENLVIINNKINNNTILKHTGLFYQEFEYELKFLYNDDDNNNSTLGKYKYINISLTVH